MYHGILIDQEFVDQNFPDTFKQFAKKQDGSWRIFGIEIEDMELNDVLVKVQEQLKDDQPWYVHIYNDNNLIVIFKNKIFTVKPHINTWKPIIEYGENLGIPIKQLDFWPNRFQDEIHYFDVK